MKNKRFLSLLAAFVLGYAVANLTARLMPKDESEAVKTTAIDSEKAQQDSHPTARSRLANEAHAPTSNDSSGTQLEAGQASSQVTPAAATNIPATDAETQALVQLQRQQKVLARKVLPGEADVFYSPGAIYKPTRIDEQAYKGNLAQGTPSALTREVVGRIEETGRPELLMEKFGSANPALLPLDLQLLQQNFITPLARRTFSGEFHSIQGGASDIVVSLSDREAELEILIKDDRGSVYESRVLPTQKSSLAWRHPADGQAVVALQNRCPWNRSYNQEMKQFFYLAGFDHVGVRYFCKNPSDSEWSELGWSVLTPQT